MPSFKDYPEFKPNLTPSQIFKLGSFGGSYWRPIHSSVLHKDISGHHNKFSFLKGISKDKLVGNGKEFGDKSINRYGVKAGSSLKSWESSGWINSRDPYGWVEWYCNFSKGRRVKDEDQRQIDRWLKTAGPDSRFRRRLVNIVKSKRTTFDDERVSPVIRQTLQHWGVKLTKKDTEV
jgi:hypothetical protein